MYILAPNQTVETYPYSIGQLRRDNPDTSFPRKPGDELLAGWDVYPVTRTDRPEHDPVTESVTEGTPELVEGKWRQTWVISPASEEEIAERREGLMAAFQAAVDNHIETTAQSRDYNSAAHLVGYINSTVPPWKAEAETFIAWRDQVWLFVFEKLAQVEAGEIEAPSSPEALIGWIPEIEWPE